MALYLGLLLFSFIITALAIVPFIDLLYRLRITHRSDTSGLTRESSPASTALHSLHIWKAGTPVGGGILMIFLVSLLYLLLFPLLSKSGVYISSNFPLKEELNIVFFTFISFGLIGLYDDLRKIFPSSQDSIPIIPKSSKQLLKFILSLFCGLLLFQNLHITALNLPVVGIWHLGWWYVPVSALIIFFFTTAFDYTDGLDGLASGLLLICLLAFWVISVASLDTPLSVFIALWLGSLLAFLYFNIFPARLWLGNAGAISFGSTLAVISLLLGKPVVLFVIGGLFVLDLSSSLLQSLSLRLLHRRLFHIAPLHHLLQIRGWPEPKIVQRAWLIGVILSILGLWLA
ncbi:MAG: Phospho-N-acetylmuramoyl-pentapeptide-transferase [Microgenomates group bacterium Gr01-1014_16]|nr:MAG: Phospho-N-acetylmuramoyl-pentapeptide-transferase [Microgenomates group bacterium Gr01-1014_16]